MSESFSYEAHSTLDAYEVQAERDSDLYLPNQWTPYDNLTIDDLLREFGSSDDPIVQELIKRIGVVEYTRHAFLTLYDESEQEKERLYEEARKDENEDGLTMNDLEGLLGEVTASLNRVTDELAKEKKNHRRTLARAVLWKDRLREATAKLKYETRSVERLETRTRRKINV